MGLGLNGGPGRTSGCRSYPTIELSDSLGLQGGIPLNRSTKQMNLHLPIFHHYPSQDRRTGFSVLIVLFRDGASIVSRCSSIIGTNAMDLTSMAGGLAQRRGDTSTGATGAWHELLTEVRCRTRFSEVK